MTDFILEDDQNVDIAIQVGDEVGNIVAGAALDAGSVTATADSPDDFTITVSEDQSTVNVKSNGELVTDATVTVSGTLVGAPLTGEIAIDVVDSAPANLVLVPGTPQTNAPATPPGGGGTTPPPAVVAVDPANGLPLYEFLGTDPTTIDPSQYTAVADVTGTDGEVLYTFAGDTVAAPPAGVVDGAFDSFTGTPTPVAPAQ